MANTIFKIGSTDYSAYVASLKVDKNYLTSEQSGRNAAGTMHIDVIAAKYKVTVNFIPMTPDQVYSILHAIDSYAGFTVSFMNPYTKQLTAITNYISTPSVEYYRYSDNLKLTKAFSISFIEL